MSTTSSAWTTADIPSQAGRTAIVTGSNTGLGMETAAELALAGATVVLASRTPAKLDAAKAEIDSRLARQSGAGSVETLVIDLGDLASVRDAAAETVERFPAIDLLINNAGIMMPPRSNTADGFEIQLGTNHLGHYAYTGQILGAITGVAGSRIVNVSSITHKAGRMRWDDLMWDQTYSRQDSYGQSKLANLLFTFELDRRLTAAGVPTVSLASHPGVSATELTRNLPGARVPGMVKVYGLAAAVIFQSAAAGAWPSLRAATDPDAAGSQYWGPVGMREFRGRPVLVMPSKAAANVDDQARLWTVSEELTGVVYPV